MNNSHIFRRIRCFFHINIQKVLGMLFEKYYSTNNVTSIILKHYHHKTTRMWLKLI